MSLNFPSPGTTCWADVSSRQYGRIGQCPRIRAKMVRSRPDSWSRFGGIDKRIAQSPVTGIITVDFVPPLAHCESWDLDWRFENP